ncbi:MAG: NAD-dependent malic enzyme [Chlamydiia bacterium]|nr:NAD-dependent malic enzyme [Chlamydiia bacterium]
MAKKRDTVAISLTGPDLLFDPMHNKGTAFSERERKLFHLHGLLPPHVSTVEEQISRLYENIQHRKTPIGKYQFLRDLMGRNMILFYQFLDRYAEEMLPIVYTPTVGEAALEYSQLYVQPKGLYLSYPQAKKIDAIFKQYPYRDVQVIVVTDGERILGLGDQGIGGMTIPVGKLSLYTLFGGIHPSKTLPILLDVGTNNPQLLQNRLYLGWHHKRLIGKQYAAFVHLFVQAVKKYFPKALLQWEDFGQANARPLLERYRKKILSFNDDIQGTSAVTLGGLNAALQITKQKLTEQKIVIFGAGSAGTGIADGLVLEMMEQGLSRQQAAAHIYLISIDGLIHFSTKEVYESQKLYVKTHADLKGWKISGEKITLMDVVRNAHPSILIGVSAQGGAFTKEIVQEMARHIKRPIIFPLSNPTAKSECTPQEALEWTEGRAILATGSPFEGVCYKNKQYQIGQCNNVYIYPGMGAGAVACEAKEVTDRMFLAAAKTLALYSPALKDPTASLFPPIAKVREISRHIAIAVAKQAIREKVSRMKNSQLTKKVDELMWEPHYPELERRE